MAALKLLLMDSLVDDSEEEYLSSTASSTDFVLALGVCDITQRKQKHRIKEFGDVVISYSLDEFSTMFKISRSTAEKLYQCVGEVAVLADIHELLPRQATGGREQVTLEKKIMLALWFITGQEPYTRLADRFNMSESTACDCTRVILQVISDHLLKKFVRWPSQQESQEIVTLYEQQDHFPGVQGFIDGTHIAVKPPPERAADYYNRKDFCSVVLQAVVREDLRFIDVVSGWPGRVHDARILRNSPLYQHSERFILPNCHLLGDGGYPCLPWLLVPFPDNGHLTAVQLRFNKILSKIRSTVERAFAHLKGRFKRLQYINQEDLKDINNTITSACVLHNLCIMNGDQIDECFLLGNDNDGAIPPNLYPQNDRVNGALKRAAIARQLP